MILRIFIGLLFLTCEQKEILLHDIEDPSLVNTTAPQIKWISPRFDAVINEKVTISKISKKDNFRSSIIDKNGNILTKTVPVINIGINPNLVIDKEKLLITLIITKGQSQK